MLEAIVAIHNMRKVVLRKGLQAPDVDVLIPLLPLKNWVRPRSVSWRVVAKPCTPRQRARLIQLASGRPESVFWGGRGLEGVGAKSWHFWIHQSACCLTALRGAARQSSNCMGQGMLGSSLGRRSKTSTSASRPLESSITCSFLIRTPSPSRSSWPLSSMRPRATCTYA